ncbi:hypothetical protein FRC06_008071 [Ceratobasidium sp. 370]|nr:hypothetical protein FRC06_008071 [Ceratobasidium sp. 370]
MPIAHRRPGLLHLVLPHPALDQAAALEPSPAASPRTPRRTSRLSDGPPCPRTSIASDKPRSSIDSWNSVDTNEIVWEWKDEELALLSRTLDNIPSHLMTPYVGVVPPPNVLDKLARNIALSRTALEWPHSVRATRVKLHELCRRKTVQKAIERRTPAPHPVTQNSPQVTEIMPPTRRPLYRQSSMDFLPVKNEPTSVTRLSSRLQRIDRLLSHSSFHPYARPSGSRSPTPPPTVDVLTRPRTRSITSSEASARPPTPRKLFRSSATPPPPQSLKRAPSFGVASIKSRAQHSRSSAPPESSSYSSDEEEKARQALAKRPRMAAHRVPSFLGAPLPPLAPSPEEEILDPLVIVPEDPIFAPTLAASTPKLPPPPRRSSKAAPKPSIPKPAAATPTPVTSAPAAVTTPRTLRRVGTRNFPASSTPAATAPAMPAPVATPRTNTGTGTRVAIGHKPHTPAASTSANSGISDEERRRERRERKERREREKEMQPADSTRRAKKRTATKEPVPSVAPMRL